MGSAQLVVAENDPYLDKYFVDQMIQQLNALDSYGTYDGWSKAKIVDPLVLTKERKQAIPIIGDPDEITIARVKAYYSALAASIERETGLMAVSLVNISHEGFGRALIMIGKLIVVDKVLRDIHRFGFRTLEEMCEQSDKLIARAKELVEKYHNAATD
ncbi:NifX-associated nitrogen fixation protein [Methylophaga sp.]|uniref:NifX-associated nitrogen fixation protein n=1 Tax=Methylophaga sp. TaxID=2024840 RepID=UPI00271C4942|nr:NifX-associated nitrogen fixation protein [Methylophaga sp.]MDO8828101.1 NifX-associated nitrogen fixation protein [Methylophaga sp.]